ncbi:FAD-dependent oxidoreductase [Sandaracinus amylolyticus]|uniref:FAD-dependent oxidoreductase n=1 Tax=Sandaracinus amylolyticus TaxID=927083 RepID=UPI001F326470|nr:FAD-dependent oxidoreductase [Sandaracinus amylolyticus]UJR87138.1 Hypothetical protein I5071_92390 [Sandaracinus amylolyticus]
MKSKKKQLAIIGNGMAASRLLDDLVAREATDRYDITVFGEEPGGAYNRVLLGRVLSGEEPDAIVIKTPSWYEDHGVRLVSTATVTKLDTASRRLQLKNGDEHPYDVAVMATGSVPLVPPLAGVFTAGGELKKGAFVYRTLDDCARIRAHVRPGDNAVVLGGGLLGLEAAKVLCDAGLHVTVVHLAPGLMETQLDHVGGQMLRKQIERTGIFVRAGRTAEAVVGEHAVEGIVLDDGQRLAAETIVIACGVRPRREVAVASGIPVNRGILVNDALATEVPGVYAVGECAEHRGMTYGIVAPVLDQAAVLASILSGRDPTARYRGSKIYARLKVAGVEVASMGIREPELESDDVIQVLEERKDAYRKLVVRNGQLVGAMLVGNTKIAAQLVQLFDRGDALPEDPLEALSSTCAAGGARSSDRVLCNCHRVALSTVMEAIDGGAATVEGVAEVTKAGTGCGSCKSEIAQLCTLRARPAAVGE